MNRILELKRLAQKKIDEAKALVESGEYDKETFDSLVSETETIKAQISDLEKVSDFDGVFDYVEEDDSDVTPNSTKAMPSANGENKTFNVAYEMKFGNESAAQIQILRELVGNDYKQKLLDQDKAYAKYLRGGTELLELNEVKLLKQQIFPFEEISELIKAGMSFSEMKATMVEAQGSLGGYAVPAQRQSEILAPLPGLTAVRGNGAVVVKLDSGNSVEFVEYTGRSADGRYAGALRGQWGSETQSPDPQNATLGMKQVTADVYTYKVPMSTSLVEDASNLVNIINADISNTLAMDEDEAFLIGDGVGKPYGILPNSVNAMSLNEVNSGGASALTSDGLLALRRGILAQYRNNGQATFIGNSDTFGDIETLKADGSTGEYRFQEMIDNGTLLRSAVAESEAMPDVGSNTFPLIYGNLAGYYIVERSGLTIARYQDSNTGINKVEFHVRRRVGGRVVKPWMFAVQKVAS